MSVIPFMRIYSDHYELLLAENHFTPVKDMDRFNPAGRCWSLSSTVGEGFYWVYAQNDLFDIKIHDSVSMTTSSWTSDYPSA